MNAHCHPSSPGPSGPPRPCPRNLYPRPSRVVGDMLPEGGPGVMPALPGWGCEKDRDTGAELGRVWEVFSEWERWWLLTQDQGTREVVSQQGRSGQKGRHLGMRTSRCLWGGAVVRGAPACSGALSLAAARRRPRGCLCSRDSCPLPIPQGALGKGHLDPCSCWSHCKGWERGYT